MGALDVGPCAARRRVGDHQKGRGNFVGECWASHGNQWGCSGASRV